MAKAWYILHTYSGYENKIERTIRTLIEKGIISADFVTDIKIPEELVIENKGGKKRNVKRKFLPGYMLVEMNLPDLGWKSVCSEIRKIQGVTGFLGTAGNEKPQPISPDEAKEILQKISELFKISVKDSMLKSSKVLLPRLPASSMKLWQIKIS